MKMNKKALSILLSLALVVSILAAPVFANPDEDGQGSTTEVGTSVDTGDDSVPTDISGTGSEGGQEDIGGSGSSEEPGSGEDPAAGTDPADIEDPEEQGTGVGEDESGWIAVIEKPANNDVTAEEAVVYRRGGRSGEIKVLASELSELTDEDFEAIKAGELEIWNGWKYKKADQKITASVDSNVTEDGELAIKYGSDPVALDADSEVKKVSYATSDASVATVENGELAPVGIGSAVISITSAGNEYYKTTVRTINVKVVKGDQVITTDNEEYKVAIGTADFPLNAASNADDAGALTYEVNDQLAVAVDAETGVVSLSDITASPAEITISAPETEHYEAAQKTVAVTVVKPSTPKLKVAAIGGKKIKLTRTDSWTDPALPRDTTKVKYEVYCPQFSKKLRSGSTTNTYITSKTLKKGKKYKCRVRAVVTVGTKKYTTAWTAYVTSPKVK